MKALEAGSRSPASAGPSGVPPAGAAASRVAVEGLTKRFPERRSWKEVLRRPFAGEEVTVLEDVSFAAGAGEFFGLLGPNGAGKTTLFRILATLLVPDGGRLRVAGHDVREEGSAVRSKLAAVLSDGRSLYWRLSARENLELFADLHGLPDRLRRDRVPSLLATVGLDGADQKMVGDYSSGMQQRLLLARALLTEPEVLLLDEPTRSLDPLAARDFRRFLREEIAGRRGCTILLATHDSEEALELCDRVGVLHEGRLLAVGTPEELMRRHGGERYRLWGRDIEDEQMSWLAERGPVVRWSRDGVDGKGWSRLSVTLAGGAEDAGELVSHLALSGATVARFERVDLPLADLLERVMGREEGGAAS